MQPEIDLPSSSRALVTLANATHDDQARDRHPHCQIRHVSNFLAQLIAAARQVPQARARRRADPSEVIAAYQATIERLQKLNEKSR